MKLVEVGDIVKIRPDMIVEIMVDEPDLEVGYLLDTRFLVLETHYNFIGNDKFIYVKCEKVGKLKLFVNEIFIVSEAEIKEEDIL